MLYDMTVPAYRNGLRALSAQLDKALAWGADNGVGELQLIVARLAPDMFPLAAQIRSSCLQALQPPSRLAATIDADPDRPVSFDLPNGMVFDMTARAYVRDWAQPQFYFHLVAAYSILRHMGVPLGKADYVGYMLAHLRSGTAPTA